MTLLPKIIALTISIFSITAIAQNDQLYASEGQRSFWFNPASIGTYNSYSASTVFKKQWDGADDSPLGVQVGGAVKLKNLLGDESKLANSAIGINYSYEQVGYKRMHRVIVPLNVQFKLQNTFLSVGISPGIQTMLFSYNEGFPPYPWIPPSGTNESKFTAGAGLQWYGERFSIGIASTHLFSERFNTLGVHAWEHYYITGSYRHPFSEKFALKAIVTVREAGYYTGANAMISGVFGSANELTVGLGYRQDNIIIGSVTKRFNRFYLGYFIEGSTTISHEVRFAFELFDDRF